MDIPDERYSFVDQQEKLSKQSSEFEEIVVLEPESPEEEIISPIQPDRAKK